MSKFKKNVQIRLTEREAARLDAELKRHGGLKTPFYRSLLLDGLSRRTQRIRADDWSADALEDLRADVKRLLRQQLHGVADPEQILQAVYRLEALVSGTERRTNTEWQS